VNDVEVNVMFILEYESRFPLTTISNR